MVTSLLSIPVTWWLAASVVLNIVATNLSWRVQTWSAGWGGHAGNIVRSLVAHPFARAAGFAYHIGPPYLALVLGLLNERVLGLSGVDWLRSSAVAAAMGLATAILLWMDGRSARFPSPPVSAPAPSTLAILWRTGFQQAHLAFYRGVLIALSGPYSGAFAALALVVGEWAADPAWRAGWAHEVQRRVLSFDLALALTTTVLFLYTGSFWACLLVHAVLAVAMRTHDRQADPATFAG